MNAHRLRLPALLPVLLLASGFALADAEPRLRERLSPYLPPTPSPAQPAESPAPAVGASNDPSPGVPESGLPAAAPDPAAPDPRLYSSRLLAELYAEGDFTPRWTDEQARSLLALAEASPDDGLEPADFRTDEIRAILDDGGLAALAGDARADADLLLSDALLRYIHHHRFGKYDPKRIRRAGADTRPVNADQLRADLDAALDAPDLSEHLAAALPQPFFYRNLKRAYQRYRTLLQAGKATPIPGGSNLKTGMTDPRVPLIRARLTRLEDWDGPPSAEPERYDEPLTEAVRAFQRRSGLATDGVVGPRTLAALNQAIDEDGMALIRANLERMRWLHDRVGDDFVFIDVAGFQLELYRGNQLAWSTPVVVGTRKDQTPMFRDEMEYVVFNPTWSVPVSIQKTMGRVGRKYQVVDRRTGRRVSGVNASNYRRYRIVQPAGPGNALGRVKFIFPNNHAVYLHDTPSKHLFSRGERAYSHGCIRVKDPLDLADRILDAPNWDQAEVKRVVNRGRTRHVHLDDHLQVLIYYLTARADADGRVGFRRDIYGRDANLIKAMQGPASPPRLVWPEPEPNPADTAPKPETEAHPSTRPAPAAQPGMRSADSDGRPAIEGAETARVEPAATVAAAAPASAGPDSTTREAEPPEQAAARPSEPKPDISDQPAGSPPAAAAAPVPAAASEPMRPRAAIAAARAPVAPAPTYRRSRPTPSVAPTPRPAPTRPADPLIPELFPSGSTLSH